MTYTSVLHTKPLLYHSRSFFLTLEPHASSDWKATSANMYCIRFLVRHFVHTTSTSQNHWRLQHYHTSNDSPTTKDASFHVISIRKVTVCRLQFRAYITVSLIVRKYMYVRQQMYCTQNDCYTLPRMHCLYK